MRNTYINQKHPLPRPILPPSLSILSFHLRAATSAREGNSRISLSLSHSCLVEIKSSDQSLSGNKINPPIPRGSLCLWILMSVNVDILQRHEARYNNSKKSEEGRRGREKGAGENESSYQDNEKYTVRAFIRRINATEDGRLVRIADAPFVLYPRIPLSPRHPAYLRHNSCSSVRGF